MNITEINKLKSNIDYYCEEMIYDPFEEYRNCGCRILNAARVFYYDALQMIRKQITANEKGVTINQNIEILKQIKAALEITDTVPVKEKMIKEILEKQHLNPEEYLYIEDWSNQLNPDAI